MEERASEREREREREKEGGGGESHIDRQGQRDVLDTIFGISLKLLLC